MLPSEGHENTAISQQNLGDYSAARRSFEEALEINTRRDDSLARTLSAFEEAVDLTMEKLDYQGPSEHAASA